MKIATAGSRTSRNWRTEDWTWMQLVDRLRTPARTGETMAEYRAMSKDEQSKRKDVGGFVGGELDGGRRKAGSVRARWLVTLDADYAEPGDWETFTLLHDVAACVYSTHSHSKEHPRLRWILPLSHAVTADEYPAVARRLAYDLALIERLDPTTYQPERLMYWPSCCEDGEYVFHEQRGGCVDPDMVLREYGPGEAWRDVSRWPTSAREGEVVQREQRQQADPLTKDGLVGAFCRCYSVEDAIDAFDLPYERCEGMRDRYTYTGGSTAAGAVVYDNGRWLYSNHATDPAGGQLCNAWDLVRIHRFGELDDSTRAQDAVRLPSYKAMTDLAGADERVRGELIDSQFGDIGSAAPISRNTVMDGANDEDGADDDGDGADEDTDAWKNLLEFDKKGNLEPSLNNACVILTHAPVFRGRLGFCDRDGLVYVIGELPWPYQSGRLSAEEEKLIMGPKWLTTDEIYAQKGYNGPPRLKGRVWSAQDRTNLYKYFERWKYSVMQTTNGGLDKAVVDAARQIKCDPLRDYLTGLTWDGVPRLDTMFIHWLGAEDCELNREITRLWMMGAVDRAMRPGHQFDSVLVFCGEQGIGKTSLLRMLAGEYYTNAVDATSMTKQTAELLQGKWIVELGELDSVKKSSATAFKNFITATTDHYRKAYATDAETYPRRCVFAGTSNEGAFLRDDTGERRVWIMPCYGQAGMNEPGKKGTLPGFAGEVGQIWAEAVEMWRARMTERRRGGEGMDDVNLCLFIQDPELDAEMEERRQGFKLPDSTREDIEEYLDTPRPDNWETMSAEAREDFFRGAWIGDGARCTYLPEIVTLKEIRTELYRERPEDAGRAGRSGMAVKIASIMNTMPGWERIGKASRGNDRSVRWRRAHREG